MSLLKLVNRTDPGRPLTLRNLPDGGTELRLGDLGITDATITLNPDETRMIVNFLTSKEAE
ncbi:hypothetical protein JS533_001520 [Bifidobacterium amazonense]|uniref:Uncharacterized protein n=1 Tax=Bifidobacterium amazonense TaxID=2809027 RepID=A0ABS9VSB1_9BIFI|nr:hypothetical protein [Bifidobacterium amazonense]MCH9274968.1 hypothetical protein [Bifidobacterium amazonense]